MLEKWSKKIIGEHAREIYTNDHWWFAEQFFNSIIVMKLLCVMIWSFEIWIPKIIVFDVLIFSVLKQNLFYLDGIPFESRKKISQIAEICCSSESYIFCVSQLSELVQHSQSFLFDISVVEKYDRKPKDIIHIHISISET